MFNIQLTPVIKNILIINVVMWVITVFVPNFNLDETFAMYDVASSKFEPWQFITHIFMHASRDGAGNIILSHILMNSLGLVFIGPMVENALGSKRFLGYYLLTGFGAAALHLGLSKLYLNYLHVEVYEFVTSPSQGGFLELCDRIINQNILINNKEVNTAYRQIYDALENPTSNVISEAESFLNLFIGFKADIPMVGASGAIYGLIAALGVLFPNTVFMLIFPPIPIKAKWLALILGGYAFYQGIQFDATDNVGHFAHLGGAIIGAILIWQWKKK